MFVFSSFVTIHFSLMVVQYIVCVLFFTVLLLLFSSANLPLGQIADENSADGAQVFICIIRVVYCTPKSSFPRMMHHRDMFLDFI